jgi:hypothetical protein
VVEGKDASTLVFETEAGRVVRVERVHKAEDLDAAVLHLAEDAREGLAVRRAEKGAEWRVETNPGGDDPGLSGTIELVDRRHKDRRSDTRLLQLGGPHRIDGSGYSGSPVVVGKIGAVVGILRKQQHSREQQLELGEKRSPSGVLYAVPIQKVLERFGLTAVWESDERGKHFINTAGRKPGNFVARPEKLKKLCRTVIGEQRAGQGGLVGLHGMPGCGKTALATALCEFKRVEEVFKDGVVWLDIGQSPRDLTGKIKQISQALTKAPGYFDTLEAGADHLKQLLEEREVLLVLDDVWDVKDMKPFMTNARGCCVLFTTRIAEIALALGVPEIALGVLTPGQAVTLLRKWANRDDPDLLRIAERVGNLPLALKLAGAQLREGNKSGKEWLADFRDVSQLRLGRYSSDPQDNLAACFDLSVNQLSEDDRGLYYALGIFSEDAQVPQRVLALLWQGLLPELSDYDCEELATHLARMALMERSPADNTFTIHDMLRGYAREKLKERSAEAHTALLGAYNPDGEFWHQIEDDGYLYDNLAYHLTASGRGDELYRLVALGDARNEWAEARYRVSGSYAGYLSDLDLAWRQAEGDEAWNVTSQIRCALIQSSIRSRAGNIPAELLLALVDQSIWTPGQAFSAATDNPDADQRATALTALASRLEEPLLSAALRQALDAALSIHIHSSNDDMRRAWAVEKLAPYLTEPLLREAMDEVRKTLVFEERTNAWPFSVRHGRRRRRGGGMICSAS